MQVQKKVTKVPLLLLEAPASVRGGEELGEQDSVVGEDSSLCLGQQ